MAIKTIPDHFTPYTQFQVPFYKPLAKEELYCWVDEYLTELGIRQ
jgi:hypothetical protein